MLSFIRFLFFWCLFVELRFFALLSGFFFGCVAVLTLDFGFLLIG